MEATHGHSKPCCNIPPVVSSGYEPKGTYEVIGGYKTYITGPEDATKAIVSVYDIFGYFDQTIQGADILAYGDDNQKYKVYMPDLLKDDFCPIDVFPPDTDAKKKQLGDFLGRHDATEVAKVLSAYVSALKHRDESLEKFGVLGFCWGGKVATCAAKAYNTPFSVLGSCHPAMVDPADTENLNVPTVLLASGDEPADDVKKFEKELKVEKHVEIFKDQIHGWMAARSDLKDDKVLKEYERGYKTLLEFFGKHI